MFPLRRELHSKLHKWKPGFTICLIYMFTCNISLTHKMLREKQKIKTVPFAGRKKTKLLHERAKNCVLNKKALTEAKHNYNIHPIPINQMK